MTIGRGGLPTPLTLLLSLIMGASFSGLAFVGHEALHGALLRNVPLRRLVGRLGFLPFALSPRLWEAWHNRVHHGNTNRAGVDPDAYPTLSEYNGSRALQRATDWVAPGRSRFAGVFSLLVGFTVQSTHMLLMARRYELLDRSQHRLALLESGAVWSLITGLAFLLGPLPFVLAFVVPLIIGNAIVMSFILTNHTLSPHTEVNDPLVNSLSVTGPRFFEWLTLGFGFHVEHHLFPAMSARHAPEVRRVVLRLWPERYQRLPYLRALIQLHRSPRVYQTSTQLFDPHTGSIWPTLMPALVPTGSARLALSAPSAEPATRSCQRQAS